MRKNGDCASRPRGRPQIRPDEETRRLLVEAGRAEFQACGYAGTTMGAVARRAGVSTKTLYRIVPTKADLFQLVVSDRIDTFMVAVDDEALAGLDLTSALERILIAYGNLTLSDEVIVMNRLVIGECERFPEIARAFYKGAIARTGETTERWLRRQCEKGLIALDDPKLANGMLRGMMIMEPQRAAILSQRTAPGSEEIAARAKLCAHLFLGGCQVRKH